MASNSQQISHKKKNSKQKCINIQKTVFFICLSVFLTQMEVY